LVVGLPMGAIMWPTGSLCDYISNINWKHYELNGRKIAREFTSSLDLLTLFSNQCHDNYLCVDLDHIMVPVAHRR